MQLNLFKDLVELFWIYPDNSLLHLKLEGIIKTALSSNPKELAEIVIVDSGLLKAILSLPENEDFWRFHYPNADVTCHQGFYAFFITLSDFLQKMESPDVRGILDSIPEWTSFKEGMLKERLELNSQNLCSNPKEDISDCIFKLDQIKELKPVP